MSLFVQHYGFIHVENISLFFLVTLILQLENLKLDCHTWQMYWTYSDMH
jgi:hypothetical protein